MVEQRLLPASHVSGGGTLSPTGEKVTVDPTHVREQFDKLQRSAVFANSSRLLALLHFLIEETLAGRGNALKETVIGNAVYGREPPYDPRIDSTVRVEARRLRRKLNEYYEGEGQHDPFRVHLPIGTYVPEFVANDVERTAPVPAEDEAGGTVFEKGSGAAVAIMPLHALTGDPEDESFADGLTDELIFALERAQGLRVTSRNIAFGYKNQSRSLAEIAAELEVDAVLQGTVRREGDFIRVTIEVSDPKGFVLWSDRIDAPSSEGMHLQERIAATIVSRAKLDSSRMRAMDISPRPVAMEARAKVYRARQLLDLQTPGALRDALDLFSHVNSTAPDYARGHAGVADCYCDMFRLGLIDHATALNVANAAAKRALEIDPGSIEAHTSIATILAWLERNAVAAEVEFQKILKLGENARAARLYAVLLTILERHAEAERMFRQSRSIEPFSVQQDIAEAISHYQARHYHLLADSSVESGQRSRAVEVAVYQSLARIFSGKPEGANQFFPDLEDAAAEQPSMVFAKAEIEAWLGTREAGLRLLNSEVATATYFARATLAAALELQDQTLSALDEAVNRRELSIVWLRTDARFDRVRGTKRFKRLVESSLG